MQLARLLEEAQAAAPDRRIEWRDQIAPFGQRAISGVEAWLADPVLASFAIRVIWRVGEQGDSEAAAKVLRSARGRLSPQLRGDVDWALAALRRAERQAAPESGPSPAPTRSSRPGRERPLYSPATRRRPR